MERLQKYSRKMTKIVSYISCVLLIIGCTKKEDFLFQKLDPDATGISFENKLDPSKNVSILDYLYYYNGGGVATGDINKDGWVDIYFTSNQGKNKLYLNKGNNKFEDISLKSGTEGKSDWKTSAIMADVNGDGYLDIYVCAVVGIHGFKGHNELFINNKDNTFTESAAQFGLALDNYSTSASFFDYDLDGDLDMYLLNHAVHSEASYGHADVKYKRDYKCGDKLFQNNNNTFVDVSEKAGIYGGANGYGLGIAISDYNLDGFPDIYICNDFQGDDFYYLNNGNGTFTESIKSRFGHTSRFSMGVDAADINHDGFTDLMTLDMLPEDETVLKSSLGDDNVQMFNKRVNDLGYHNQYTRNMLQINNAGANFTETALMSGVAATDWSWSTLFADYDQDGEQDIFVSNGIAKRPNDLDYVKYLSNDEIKIRLNSSKMFDKEALQKMPSGSVPNYVYKGNANLTFEDKSKSWMANDTLISNGTAFADLDNDGDLDIITNNLNSKASIYSNQTNSKANYLKVKLQFEGKNSFGIGTKVLAYSKGKMQYREVQSTRGFQSSSETGAHFGLKKEKLVDSLVVIWPDNTYQTIKQVKANQTLKISAAAKRSAFNYNTLHPVQENKFKKVDANLGINFTHVENDYVDFVYQKLIPYQRSDRGPATAVGDLNGDGKDDLFFGGSKGIAAQVFVQTNKGFVKKQYANLDKDAVYEDASAVIVDSNKDQINELFVASGGGQNGADLLSRAYSGPILARTNFPKIAQNASVIKSCDYDKDGDMDLFIGTNSDANKFGSSSDCYLLNNNNGNYKIVQNQTFHHLGMVTDAVFSDYNKDGYSDLILVGEWMKPLFFANRKGVFQNETDQVHPDNNNGLFQSVHPFDIDKDGDLDYLVGNWGLNSKFKASADFPMKMYFDDFDTNGTFETIVAVEKNGNYYTTMGLDELSEEFSGMLKKKFNEYKSFAGKQLEEIFDSEMLEKAKLYEVHNLRSGYLKNEKGLFTFVPFENALQVAPLTTFVTLNESANAKDKMVFVAGNYFGTTPYHSRFDGFSGALIQTNKKIQLGNTIGIDLSGKAVRHLDMITIQSKKYMLVTLNNKPVELYEVLTK